MCVCVCVCVCVFTAHAPACVVLSQRVLCAGAAIAAAASSDIVVLCIGTDQSLAGEVNIPPRSLLRGRVSVVTRVVPPQGTDLANISLPGIQADFYAAVRAATGSKPLIVVLVSSFAISFDVTLADALVLAYTPSFGAPAIAAALFGVNRWGRAVMTHYPLSVS